MKRTALFFLLLGPYLHGVACSVCEKQQPKITMGLTHGVGPQSNWDWVIISVIVFITIINLIFSIKYLIKPGEKSKSHIKKSILNNQ